MSSFKDLILTFAPWILAVVCAAFWFCSERKRSRESPVRLRERNVMRQYLQTVAVAVIVIDSAGTILVMNPALCKLFGFSEHEILRKHYFELLARKDLLEVRFRNFRRIV